jgi:hypothetical protein
MRSLILFSCSRTCAFGMVVETRVGALLCTAFVEREKAAGLHILLSGAMQRPARGFLFPAGLRARPRRAWQLQALTPMQRKWPIFVQLAAPVMHGLRAKPAMTKSAMRARAQQRWAAVARTRGATGAPPRHWRGPPADSRALPARAPTRVGRTARRSALRVPGAGFANVNSFQSPCTAVPWTIMGDCSPGSHRQP